MNSIAELLKHADPLNSEGGWSAERRLVARQAIVSAPPASRWKLPPVAPAVILAIALIATASAGVRLWSGASVVLEAAVRFEVRLAEDTPAPGLRAATIAGSEQQVFLHEDVVVGNGDIAQARLRQDDSGTRFGVTVVFSTDGATKMARATSGHVGARLAILLDGRVVSAPVIRTPISSTAYINGDYTRAEAARIVDGIIGR